MSHHCHALFCETNVPPRLHMCWLEDLLAERNEQIEAGTWPPAKETAP